METFPGTPVRGHARFSTSGVTLGGLADKRSMSLNMGSQSGQEQNEALERLLDAVTPRFKRILCRSRIPEQDAEDLVQELLLSYISKSSEVRDPQAWLTSAMKYRCLMYWRRRRRRLWVAVDQALLDALIEPDSSDEERVALAHDFDRVLPQIPPRCRSLLQLRYGMGLKPREVARVLGYSRSSVWNITKRCLSALTRRLLVAGYHDLERDNEQASVA